MKKEILVPIVAILSLSMMLILPALVKAIEKEPISGLVTYTGWRYGESYRFWITKDGVIHERDYYWSAIFEGSLGTGTCEYWYRLWTYDPATDEMACEGTWWLTIPDIGTIKGSWVGHGGYGTALATHGVDGFAGAMIKCSFTLVSVTPPQFYCTGTITWP